MRRCNYGYNCISTRNSISVTYEDGSPFDSSDDFHVILAKTQFQ